MKTLLYYTGQWKLYSKYSFRHLLIDSKISSKKKKKKKKNLNIFESKDNMKDLFMILVVPSNKAMLLYQTPFI